MAGHGGGKALPQTEPLIDHTTSGDEEDRPAKQQRGVGGNQNENPPGALPQHGVEHSKPGKDIGDPEQWHEIAPEIAEIARTDDGNH